jgi:uncharacterized protein (UPF0276 family)
MQSFQLAVNYSEALAELVRAGEVDVDYFKVPAWPELVARAAALRPVYVHFPLSLDGDHDRPVDTERKAPVEWDRVDRLLKSTGTPYVNVHLRPYLLPGETDARMYRRVKRNLFALIERYGAERVIVENEPGGAVNGPAPGLDPDLMARLVEESGCGFLLDISHARLAAERCGWPEGAYLRRLPLRQVREVHVTGIQYIDAAWQRRAQEAGIDQAFIDRIANRRQDHLPFTPEDWPVVDDVLSQLRRQHGATPWIVAFEYGGVGMPWEIIGETPIFRRQVPRLAALLAQIRNGAASRAS